MQRPSPSSSANPVSHSRSTAQRSQQYHDSCIDNSCVRPTAVGRGSLKMTRSEHQLNNAEDQDEKGHKL